MSVLGVDYTLKLVKMVNFMCIFYKKVSLDDDSRAQESGRGHTYLKTGSATLQPSDLGESLNL